MLSENSRVHPLIFPAFKNIEEESISLRRNTYVYAEISLKIFAELNLPDLNQAKLVCRAWKQLIQSSNLLKKFDSVSPRITALKENSLEVDQADLLDPSANQWTPKQIAIFLWQNPTTIISDSLVAKVNAAAAYLKEEGFELKGVASDGDCFFSAFLESYAYLSRIIPLLEEQADKISYLRQVLSGIVKHTDSQRAEEIREKGAWISGLNEGDLLASALSIPIRLITVNKEQQMCGIHDRLIFSEAGLTEEHRSQEWKTISPEQQPAEYIFIIDLGGHFVYAEPLKQTKSLPSNSVTSPDFLFSDPLSKDKLKKTLESLGDDELLSKEKVKEAEKAYTLALQIAVREKDAIQESIYIERIGDVYLKKGTSKTLLRAAGLYQYALRLSSEDRQEIIKEKIFNIQGLLTTLCEGKLLSHEVMRKQFEDNSKALKKFREKIEEKIQVLPETPSSEKVRTLYAEIAQQIKIFFKFLAMQAIETLGPAPCEYAMIGFGSLAREEMTPYSDLEFGILIQDDTSSNKEYFKHLTTLLHLKIINLGETILPALNIPCLKAIDFFDGITPRGFAFDGAGVEGKGCKTPFGNGKTFELIQTPEKMAQYVGKDEKGHWWHEKEPHLPMELLNHTHLLGNGELTKAYDEKIREVLDMTYQGSVDLRHYLAKEHLVLADMETFNPGMGDPNKHGMLFQVKNDFYRFPHLAIDRLALLKKVTVSDTFTRIDKLSERGIITQGATKKLKDWMSLALFMRFKTYSHYQAQKEMMNPLLKPFGFEDPDLIQKQFALDNPSLEKIKKIYQVFIPFYQAIKEFLAGNEDELKSSDLEDNSPEIQGHIYQRLFQHKEAEKWYLLAKKTNPQNLDVLNALAIIYYKQGNLDRAKEYLNKAFTIDRQLFGENHPTMAISYSTLGAIYKEQGKLDKAAEYSQKALAIVHKLFGDNHPDVAANYSNLGIIYTEQGNLDKAAKYSQKALAIVHKLFGDNHPAVATNYSNLGNILQGQGHLGKALEYSQKALAIDRKLFGENHPTIAIRYSNLGAIYKEQGKLDKAAEYSQKSLAINLKLFGENHPAVATYYSDLGAIYQNQGNLDKAIEYVKKALAINLKLFGENHSAVATNYNDLGAIYTEQGKLDKAAEYSQKSLAINLKLSGENHPTIAIRYSNLGQIYQGRGKLDKAAEYSQKALVINLKLFGENHPTVAIRYSNLGQIYQEQGKLDKAAEYSQKALAIDLKLFGENNPTIAIRYNNLGAIYKDEGNLDKAAEYSQKSLAINFKLFGGNHPAVARNYNNLAAIYKDEGNLDKAAEYAEKGLAIDLKLFGENHPSIAIRYNNLGQIYQGQGKLNKAAEYSQKALAIDFKLFGENHSTVATNYNNLGAIYKDEGKLDKAAEYSHKALAINLTLFGDNHPTMATCYSNLGIIYKKQGKLDKAAEYSQKALAINIKLFGENHPTVARDYNNLGQIFKEQDNLDKAAEYSQKALAIHSKLFGETHFNVAIRYNNLGQIYRHQGNLDKAAENTEKALAINLKLFGETHFNVATNYNNLGLIYQEQGNLEKAVEYSAKALAINLKLFGENHPEVAICYNNLGQIYKDQGNLDKAKDYTHNALAINLKLFGENHPEVAICYDNLGQIYQDQGHLDKAKDYTHNALAINLKLFGENHPEVAICYNNLGQIYQEQGTLDKAVEYANKALAINLNLFGKNHLTVAIRYNNLGQIYKKQGNLDKAAEYVEKALAINLNLFGENHSKIATNYNDLGEIYQLKGNMEKALECVNHALRIAINIYGNNHPIVAALVTRQQALEKEKYDTKKRNSP